MAREIYVPAVKFLIITGRTLLPMFNQRGDVGISFRKNQVPSS